MHNTGTRSFDLYEFRNLVLLVFAVFLIRSLFTNMPEIADAVKKWDIAVGIASTHDLGLLLARDHHSARWGIVLPVALLVKVLGANLTAYYSICLAQYAIIFGILYTFARRDIAPGLLLPLAVLLFFEPMFFRATTQIQPFIFGVFYIVVALFLLQKHLETRGMLPLLFAALFCFFAYGAKETYLFFVVGVGILVLWRGSLLSTAIFCATLLGLLLIETIVFNTLSGDLTFGRIEFLAGGKHQIGMTTHTVAG